MCVNCKSLYMVSSNLQGLGSKNSLGLLKNKDICRLNQIIPYSCDFPMMVRLPF
ncbi:hypothetical protein MtrunA17_Chr7g0254581 [Medicago truncatula]|uniref:Uncharacterized protein n=1 Tax=Medicago truncatula TaxID=3880 RepID=A0A396H8S5_MEDTR|nr:hypothetical protein MtrunA17_Chr7g0254581 [Medicago truncatula]